MIYLRYENALVFLQIDRKMNLHQDLTMGLRPNQPASLNLNLSNSTTQQRARLPRDVHDELVRNSPSTDSSLPSFLPSPARLIQQLPASPASLLLSPLIKKTENQSFSNSSSLFLLNGDYETNLIEQIDHYFLRRKQYLQHNIDVSLNVSKWLLEHIVFYSVETLRFFLFVNV